MAIQARCPHCEATIRAAEKYAGQQVKCPQCGNAILVPALTAPTPPPAAPTPMAAAEMPSETPLINVGEDEPWRKAVTKKPASKRRRSSSQPAWLWPAVGAGACAVALAIGAGIWMQQSDGPVANNNDAFDDRTVAQTSSAAKASVPSSADLEPVAERSPDDSLLTTSRDEPPVRQELSPQTETEPGPATASGESVAAITSVPLPMDDGQKNSTDSETTEMAAKDAADAKPSDAKPTDRPVEMSTTASASETPAPIDPNLPPDKVLEERGLRVVGEQVALIDESATAIRASLREAQKLRLTLTKAFAEAMKLEQLQKNLKAEYGARSAALAQVNASDPSNVSANNALVGQLNVISTKTEQVDEALETARGNLSKAREAYIEHLLKTRAVVEEVETRYEELAADPQVKAALAKLSQEGGTELAVEPLGSFHRAQKDLQELESQVLSDTITARVQSGNLHVATMINGEHTIEMVVDSGASVVTLPYTMAVEAGLKPKDSDPVAQFQIADGSLITGRMITIASLRVGKFTVENVEAAVLDPEAVNATPLLGMSFLGKFETKIDSNRGQLVLSRIEGTEGSEKIR